jgi:hypothetical protein
VLGISRRPPVSEDQHLLAALDRSSNRFSHPRNQTYAGGIVEQSLCRLDVFPNSLPDDALPLVG